VPRLVQALAGKKMIGAAAGGSHTVVQTDEGELFTFGCGGKGEFGLDTVAVGAEWHAMSICRGWSQRPSIELKPGPRQFTSASWGYFLSIVIPEKLSYLAAVVVMLAQMMFSGANPSLPMIDKSMAWAAWMPNFVFLRWGQEALYITEVQPAIDADPFAQTRIEDSMMEMHKYATDHFWGDIGGCLLIGIILRILAYLALAYMNLDKQAQV